MSMTNWRDSASACSGAERRSGTRRGAAITSTTRPTSATAPPMGVISKMPRGSPIRSSSSPEMIRLVLVPSTVTTPPRIAAYDSGSRKREGGTLCDRHHACTSGMSIATSGVLLNSVDAAAVGNSSRLSDARPPPLPSMRVVIDESSAVFWAARAST